MAVRRTGRSAERGEAKRIVGKTIEKVEQSASRLDIVFSDGSSCELRVEEGDLLLRVPEADPAGPTLRQREYLRFIQKYIDEYRVAPSESRIQAHFFVSGPSVHQMIVMLEKRGFIERTPGVARSIRFSDPAIRW